MVLNFFGAGSAPAAEEDLLIVMIGGSPPGTPPIHSEKVAWNGTRVVAFAKRTAES